MKFGSLVEAMAAVSRVATEDFEPDALLRRLCEVAATTLDVDGVGVMAADGTRAAVRTRRRTARAAGGDVAGAATAGTVR